MVFIGGRKKDSIVRKKMYRMLMIGIVLFLSTYTMMVLSWWSYLETNSMDYFMGLPKPTAWMVFGMLLIPTFISFFYVTKFDDWVYTDADQQRFKEIVAKRREREQL